MIRASSRYLHSFQVLLVLIVDMTYKFTISVYNAATAHCLATHNRYMHSIRKLALYDI